MTPRHFVYGIITGTPEITDLIGGATDPRIFAKKTMTSNIEDYPLLVYKLGNETAEDLSEDTDISRQFVQIWIHDYHDTKVADFDKIDAIASALKRAFKNKGTDGIWTTIYLETSQDLNDETLNSVFRYLRFQLVREEVQS